VLLDVVCYDNWPVAGVKLMQFVARLPGSSLIFGSSLLRKAANLIGAGFPSGFHDKSKATDDIREDYARTVASTAERVRRFKKFLLAGDNKYTMEIAPDLKKLAIPTLIIWAENDPYINVSWGRRLAAEIPNSANLVIPDCGHYVPWEKARELAEAILGFLQKNSRIGRCDPIRG
jgi:pimeloyl-ACP methyl ester carboxylesterase